ncbi:MAG: flagellar hook protein FlgE [Proteobacteria bacterium]|nr:flagellar hook protein FlgE [Pseudomonadota bacterium]
MTISGVTASAVSALTANATRVAAVADNVANVGTVGFKATAVRTTTLVTGQGAGGDFAAGGVRTVARPSVAVQGVLESTNSATDLAVAGDGLFPVEGPAGGRLFTRAGAFSPDGDGFLANTAGFRLLAFPTDGAGQPTGSALEPVNLDRVGGTAAPTTRLGLGANLPADAAVGDSVNVTARVRDSLGNALDVTLNFRKVGANRHTLTIGDPVAAGAVAGTAREGGAGGPPFAVDVVFNGDGSLRGFDTDQDGTVDGGTPPILHVDGLSTGGADLDIALDLGSAGGLDGLTQFSGGFTLGFIDSDGARFGTVSGVDISSDGSVTALFDNGERRAIYQIPLATFANPDGLQAKTGNVFAETAASGQALLGTPGSGANGTVQAGALEHSNVDLAGEFANLIQAGVAYGFAVAVLRTADEMVRTLLDIKA